MAQARSLLAAGGLIVSAFSCSGPGTPDADVLTSLVTSDGQEPQYTEDGHLVLPGTPPPGKLKEKLQRHHPGVLESGVPEGQTVWFIVDEELRVLRTGIAPREGLANRVMREYPAEATEFVLGFAVERSSGEALPFPVTQEARDAAMSDSERSAVE